MEGRSNKQRLTGLRLMTGEETELAQSSLLSWTGSMKGRHRRPAASVCHAVSPNGVKHDGATAKTCDPMQNGMEDTAWLEKSGGEGQHSWGWGG